MKLQLHIEMDCCYELLEYDIDPYLYSITPPKITYLIINMQPYIITIIKFPFTHVII